jgi:hypothetical protein
MNMGKDDQLIAAVASSLEVFGSAQIRTGERRTVTAARKISKAAAAAADVEVKTSDKGDHLLVTVK